MATEVTENNTTETTAETSMSAPAAEAAETLDFATAGEILDQAGGDRHESKTDALDDAPEVDPLADSADTDPLAGEDDLDALLGADGDAAHDGEGEETIIAEEEPGAAGETATDYSRLPPRVAAVLRQAEAMGCSFEEAEAAIFGPAGGHPGDRDSGMAPEEYGGQDLAAADHELAHLRALRRQAAADFTNPTRALELTEQIEARQLVLATERARRQLQAAETADARQQHEAAVLDDMQGRFPGAFVPGNRLHDAILADRNRLSQSHPAFFADPDWAETLVRKHASRLGIVETKPGASAATGRGAQAARHGSPPRRTARPLPAPGGRSAAPHQLTEAGMSKAIRAAQSRGDAATLDFILKHGRVPAAA